MGKYTIVLEARAEKDLKRHYKAGDKGTIKRINQIYDELKIHPTTGIGNPEALKHNLSGIWSRKINSKDRLIYKVEENIVTVFIISALGHYGDK
ncbi:Txe/YoeB family addiction module toxin [Pedobacter frigiditerrae]|uniref:Txe/YoeB family addiction module toxin n=1 Tax=Pedobacter frigiditerrae TaxID=2530452 RepID=UPI00292EDED0|nr:Txe/YoeB family addiction module toxin [Pedobacter frigiditerrae]